MSQFRGSALLLGYVAATGRLSTLLHVSAVQWGFALVTGLLLLAFTLTVVAGLCHASATGVTAVAAGAPIATAALVAVTRRGAVPPMQLLGAGLVLAAVLIVYVVGGAEESDAAARHGAAGSP